MSKVRRKRGFRPGIDRLEDRVVLTGTFVAIAYVDAHVASTVHDGKSWATAFNNLQDALDQAPPPNDILQIRMAQGTYTPSKVYSPLDAGGHAVVGGMSGMNAPQLMTFDIPNNVVIDGGFVAGQTSLSARNPKAHPTILSGDLDGNDIEDQSAPGAAASKMDNAWHVVTLGDNVSKTGAFATLDGLTIKDGYAVGPNVGGTLAPFVEGDSDGGGINSTFHSNLTVNNVTFVDNFAKSDGGGLFSDGSDLVVTNSTFVGNSALVRAGGLEGLNDFENGVSHTSTLINDTFKDNYCAVFGGAVVGEGASQGTASGMTISRSTFDHNVAAEGGALTFDTLTIKVDRSKFNDNIATVDAGAIATTNVVGTITHEPNHFATTVTNSAFTGNVCLADAAAHQALDFFSGPTPGLNFAFGGGALVAYMNGYINADHDVFSHNSTQNGDGGAILNGHASANLFGVTAYNVETTVTHSQFIGNRAENGNGGAIASEPDNLVSGESVDSQTLNLSGSQFVGNRATGNGGAISLDRSTATLDSTSFAGNRAPNQDDVFATNSQVTRTRTR